MAKRAKGKAPRSSKTASSARSRATSGRSVKRPIKKAQPKRKTLVTAKARKTVKSKGKTAPKRATATRRPSQKTQAKTARPAAVRAARPTHGNPRLDRARRTLDETVPTPPSSLNMDRKGTAARTGRAEMAESLEDHRGMSPDIAGGDVDVDVEDAYFTGDEAPGGDNSTPDQDIVDDIGKALGVQYDDTEELKSTDKITERDKHRWEMDPASSEDYKERK
jgi:hypothetical protein